MANRFDFSEHELIELKASLYFLKIHELKELCELYNLSTKGYKNDLVDRVIVFVSTGQKMEISEFPLASQALKGQSYELKADEKILYGAYKNDTKTRSFLKSLIGDHFHFTAYGIDWINDLWHSGKPPTYKEFAVFWQQEYLARKIEKKAPKKEWALIHFVKEFIAHNPDADRNEVIQAWNRERLAQMHRVKILLKL